MTPERDHESKASAELLGAPPQYSPEGRLYWNGRQWVPVQPAAPVPRSESKSRFVVALIVVLVVLFVVAGVSASNTLGGPTANSVTGTIGPRTVVVGVPVTITLDLAGFNQDIETLTLGFNGDLHDHHTIDGVTIALDDGSATDCYPDRNDSKFYTCAGVKQTQKAEVVITAVPKDSGNFKPTVTFSVGAPGSGSFRSFASHTGSVFDEVVHPS